jgi:hypothetical protein
MTFRPGRLEMPSGPRLASVTFESEVSNIDDAIDHHGVESRNVGALAHCDITV